MADLANNSHTVRGYCALCTAHCATIATVTDGKVVRLEADSDHPTAAFFASKARRRRSWFIILTGSIFR